MSSMHLRYFFEKDFKIKSHAREDIQNITKKPKLNFVTNIIF